MTIKKIAEVKAEISSQFADNTSKAITPAKLRLVVEDIADSFKDTIAILDCTENTVAVSLSVTPIVLAGVWNGPTRADTGMSVQPLTGSITGFSSPGFDHSFEFVATMFGSTADIEARLYVNGSPTLATDEISLQGNNRPQTLKLSSYWQAIPAGAVFSLWIKANKTISVQMPRGFMRLTRKPT